MRKIFLCSCSFFCESKIKSDVLRARRGQFDGGQPGRPVQMSNNSTNSNNNDGQLNAINSSPKSSSSNIIFGVGGGGGQKFFASKWLTLLLSQLVMVSSGALYCFPLYSQTMKERLNLTQEQLTFIGTCGNFGAFFSVLGGMYFDRFGSKATLFLGGTCKVIGFGMTTMILRGIIFPQTVFFSSVAAYIMGTGCSTSLTAALGANYANFTDKTQHGRLVGLIMAFFGLSSGVFSIVFDVFFTNTGSDIGKNSVAFVQFLAVFCGGVDILCSTVVGIPRGFALPPSSTLDEMNSSNAMNINNESSRNAGSMVDDFKRAFVTGTLTVDDRLRWSLTITAIGAVHVAVSGYLAHQFGSQATSPFALFIFACIAYSLYRVTTLGTNSLLRHKSELVAVSSVVSTDQKSLEMKSMDDVENPQSASSNGLNKKTNLSPTEVLQEMNFYLIFVALMFSLGSGVTVINNLTQIAKAFGENLPSSMPLTLLKMFACTNTLGRLHAGHWSDKLSKRSVDGNGVKESHSSRKLRVLGGTTSSNIVSSFISNFDTSGRVGRVRFTSFLIVGAFFGMIACWTASEDMPSSILALTLTIGCAVTGWFYGALFWSMPTVTIDIFGPKHFGANRGLVGLAPAVGGYLMSTKIAGAVYQYSAVFDEGWKCTSGRVCYAQAFFINTILVVIAYCSILVLCRRRNE